MTTSTQEKEYCIAFIIRDGDWDIAETFTAANDDAANEYAEENYVDNDWWFVLNAAGKDINGGHYGGETDYCPLALRQRAATPNRENDQ